MCYKMQKDLLDSLVEKPQRETAGSDASVRFDYQKDWAFCRMLKLHLDEKEFLVAFEYHDDVVFLNKEVSPDEVEFFQVKTLKSPSARKLNTLTSKKENTHSILGKMYQNLSGLQGIENIKIILVSNRPYEFSSSNVCANQIADKFKNKIIEKLQEEYGDIDLSVLNKLYFFVSDIPLDGIETHINGLSMNLFKNKFGEDHGYNIHSWIRLIRGEISRKNNYSSDEIVTVDQLIKNKCISNQFINDTLTAIESTHKDIPDLSLISKELEKCGWSTLDIMKFNKNFPSAISDFKDPLNTECKKICSVIEDFFKNQGSDDDFGTMLDDAYHAVESKLKLQVPYNSKIYISILTVVIFYGQL